MPNTEQPTVVAIDDWMVYARDTGGRIVQTCAEMWPEWLDFETDPSDMSPDEYRAAVLQILRHKHPVWTDFESWMIEGEIEDAKRRGEVLTPEQARADLGDFLDLSMLISQQAPFFAAHRATA